MDSLSLVQSLVAVFVVAFVGAFTARKLRQPVLTGYLLAGLLASIFLGRFVHFETAKILANLGLAFLMFVIGLEFSLRRLSRVRNVAVFGGAAQMVLTTLILWLATGNLVMATVFSLSSTAIVVKLLSESGQLDTLPSEIIVGWLLVQDLAVVPILSILPVAVAGGGVGPMVSGVIISLFKSAVLLYLVLILGKKVLPRLITRVAALGSREVLLISIVGLVLLSATITSYVGLSFALGAFLAGLLVSDSVAQHAIFSEVRPLRDVFSVVFFVTLGVLVSPNYIFQNIGLILGLVVLVSVVKFGLVTGITAFFKYHLKTSLQVGLSLIQVGEFAFVVASLALAGSLIDTGTYSLILAVTVITMMIAPWEIRTAVWLYDFLKIKASKWSPRLYQSAFSGFDRYRKDHEEIILSNHIVICGHGRVGRHITRILAMAGVPYVVIDYNQNAIADLGVAGAITVMGDPTDKEVLAFAKTSQAKIVVVAVPDKYSQELIIANAQNLKPGVTVLCRSHFEEDKNRLYALGATEVISPELEAGLSISHRILDTLRFDKAKTSSYLKQVRKENT